MILTADDPDWEPIAEAAFAELASLSALARIDVGSLSDCRRHQREAAMTALDALGLVLALALLAYLVVALLYPEKFE